jgi:hypothetical protein
MSDPLAGRCRGALDLVGWATSALGECQDQAVVARSQLLPGCRARNLEMPPDQPHHDVAASLALSAA